MITRTEDGLRFLQSELLLSAGLDKHGWFDSSLGDVKYRPNNPHGDPEWSGQEVVASRWGRACSVLGIEPKELVLGTGLLQTSKIIKLTRFEQGSEAGPADAYVVKDKAVAIGLNAADCVLGIMYDPKLRILGSFHGGFKGSCKSEIAKVTLDGMVALGAKPENIVVGMGPQLGPGHGFPRMDVDGVSTEELLTNRFCAPADGDVDVQATHVAALVAGGVKQNNIDLSHIDTFDDPNWYSWARDSHSPYIRMRRNPSIASL